MIIGAPRIKTVAGRVSLCAPVAAEGHAPALPGELRFSVREGPTPDGPHLADPFLVGLVPVAMKLGEDIHVEAPVSEALAFGLETYRALLCAWFPSLFRPIGLRCEMLMARSGDAAPAGVGCCFSGGVDSWFAVLEALPPGRELPGYRLTHAVMINGFDQFNDRQDETASQRMFEAYQPFFSGRGVELIMVDTNLKTFRDTVFARPELVCSFGSALTACAHALGSLLGVILIPGHVGLRYRDMEPSGAHMALDHHLGTRQLQVIHAASGSSRSEKIEKLADLDDVRNGLRVCVGDLRFDRTTGGVVNCCHCEKCVRTITALDILGKLDAFPVFAGHAPISEYRNVETAARTPRVFLEDNLRLAIRVGHRPWQRVLSRARHEQLQRARARRAERRRE